MPLSNGRRFYKLTGSGNDFIFFDLADGPAGGLETPAAIAALCARGTGVGADGVVFMDASARGQITIRYYNSDGSLGELCGNATLCAVRLAEHLGVDCSSDLEIRTDAGTASARLRDGLPEIDPAAVSDFAADYAAIELEPGEERLGFAVAGVPHVTILVSDAERADVLHRGSRIRRHPSLSAGANVNFVSERDAAAGLWLIRTYERGVEGETLACGTGAVASAILLTLWGKGEGPISFLTRSGRILRVRLEHRGDSWRASLRGGADLVFTGELPGPITQAPEIR